MKGITQPNSTKHYRLILLLFTICSLLIQKVNSQVTFLESSKITEDAFYFWKADDSKPYHYGRSINPHGNCMKISNGFVFLHGIVEVGQIEL